MSVLNWYREGGEAQERRRRPALNSTLASEGCSVSAYGASVPSRGREFEAIIGNHSRASCPDIMLYTSCPGVQSAHWSLKW